MDQTVTINEIIQQLNITLSSLNNFQFNYIAIGQNIFFKFS